LSRDHDFQIKGTTLSEGTVHWKGKNVRELTTTRKGRGDAAVEKLASLARLLVDAGEQPGGARPGMAANGRNPRRAASCARGIGRGGEVRWPAAEAEGQRRRRGHAYVRRFAGDEPDGGG
jgi:hypothetical protein